MSGGRTASSRRSSTSSPTSRPGTASPDRRWSSRPRPRSRSRPDAPPASIATGSSTSRPRNDRRAIDRGARGGLDRPGRHRVRLERGRGDPARRRPLYPGRQLRHPRPRARPFRLLCPPEAAQRPRPPWPRRFPFSPPQTPPSARPPRGGGVRGGGATAGLGNGGGPPGPLLPSQVMTPPPAIAPDGPRVVFARSPLRGPPPPIDESFD